MVAALRPDDINVALLVHVAGAMVLVGGLLAAAAAAIIGWRDESPALRVLSYKTLLAVVLPAFVVTRVAGEWVYVKENLDDQPDQVWVGIGFITTDLGGILLLLALVLGGVGLYRTRRGGGGALLKTSGVIATVLLAAYVIAIWAMGAKPT